MKINHIINIFAKLKNGTLSGVEGFCTLLKLYASTSPSILKKTLKLILAKVLIIPTTLIGASAGIIVWIFTTTLKLIDQSSLIPEGILVGALVGIGFGFILPFGNQNVRNSPRKTRNTVLTSAFINAFFGIVLFSGSDLIVSEMSGVTKILFSIQKWVALGLVLSLTFSLYEKRFSCKIRAVLGGILTGLIAGMMIEIFIHYWKLDSILLLIPYCIFGILMINTIVHFGRASKQAWLKTLNGNLSGIEFILTETVHYIGSQPSDDINLLDYKDINRTHAKVIMCDGEFSLLDNDPFARTYINFRPVQEQQLKNGDILKIGSALLQFCCKPVILRKTEKT